MHTISIREIITFSWETFKKRPWYVIGAPLLVCLVLIIINLALSEVAKVGVTVMILTFVVNMVMQILYNIGMTKFFIKIESNVEEARLKDFWYPSPFWRFIGASLLVAGCSILVVLASAAVAGVFAGLAYAMGLKAGATFLVVFVPLLLVASVALALAFFPLKYVAVQHAIGPVGVVGRTWDATKGKRLKILLFVLTILGLNLLGLLALIVGLFVTIPMTAIATVRMSRLLDESVSATAAQA